MNWTATGASALALAVTIGAFGAHGLRGRLDDYSMNVYERAVLYHFVHALGILLVAVFGGPASAARRELDWLICYWPESRSSPEACTRWHSAATACWAP